MARFFVVLLLLVGAAGLALWYLTPLSPEVEPGSTLVMEIRGDFVEATGPSLLSGLLADQPTPFAALLSDLKKASRDERIDAVVLRIEPLGIGWGKAEEVRWAIEAISAAGKRTVALLEMASFGANLEYFVASAADEVVVSPATQSPVVGLAAEYLFLGGVWEKVGIGLEVERIGRYKTAADAIAGREMTPAHREMANALLDSIDEQFVAGIASGRGLQHGAVRRAIDAAPSDPEELVAAGLADGVRHYDQVVAGLGGPVVEGRDYARVGLADVGIESVTQFALVYGSGNVVQGRAPATPARPILASHTVSEALVDAALDESFAGIIFRIDSPGGSAFASDQVWRATQVARKQGKPLVASFSDVAASGGYYVAAGADAIVAPGTSITGSIGVVSLRPVLRGLYDKLGIGVESLTRGERADLLLSSEPLSEESRESWRREIQATYELFLERVAQGRDLEIDEVDRLARGRVWTGAQAFELGLVDELGGLRVAVERAKREAGIAPEEDVVLVPYPPRRSLAEQLSETLWRAGAALRPELPLPAVLRRGVLARLEQWVAAVDGAGPALLPSIVFDVR